MNLEVELSSALERHLTGPDGRAPRNLVESIRYSLLAPGKRIRPRLLLACSKMLGLDEAAAVPAALALEMIHCFTLIHDDLPCMDDDDFRRGLPSNHKVHGEAIALLAGDGLISTAIDTFLETASRLPSDRVIAALRRLNSALGPRGVVGGQASEALMSRESTIESLEHMHAQKTGALFAAALLVPMDLAGIEPAGPEGKAIGGLAEALGLAFQVADDLEDAPKTGGKPELTSILSRMPADEARDRTLARLQPAIEAVERRWAERSAPLLAIAREVVKSLK